MAAFSSEETEANIQYNLILEHKSVRLLRELCHSAFCSWRSQRRLVKINRGLAAPEAIAFSLILHEPFSLTFQPYESAEVELRFYLFIISFFFPSSGFLKVRLCRL